MRTEIAINGGEKTRATCKGMMISYWKCDEVRLCVVRSDDGRGKKPGWATNGMTVALTEEEVGKSSSWLGWAGPGWLAGW